MNLLNFPGFGLGIVDVVIILAVIIFAVLGWKNGFLVKIVEMASGIFGLLGSLLLARPFSPFVGKYLGEMINSKIGEFLSQSPLFSETLSEANVRAAFADMKMADFLVDWIVESIDFTELQSTIVEAIQPKIYDVAILVVSFIVLFFGSIVVFFILKLLAHAITSAPVIKEIDKVLGVLFGLVKIGAIVYILFFVLALLLTIPAMNNLIGGFLSVDMALGSEQFRLSKYLYDNNILKQLLDLFL